MINDKVILDVSSSRIIQQHMRGESACNIKVFESGPEKQLKLQVITEKGNQIISDLYGNEWYRLTSPEFFKSHYLIIKRLDKGHGLFVHVRGLLGGGNGASSSRSGEIFLGADWKESVQLAIRALPPLLEPAIKPSVTEQKRLNMGLKNAVKKKSFQNVVNSLNKGAHPNMPFDQYEFYGSEVFQTALFYAIDSECPVEILDMMISRYNGHKDYMKQPALAAIIMTTISKKLHPKRKFSAASYLTTVQLLLNHRAIPDETYTTIVGMHHLQIERNVYHDAILNTEFKIAQLLIESRRFDPYKKFKEESLFKITFNYSDNLEYRNQARALMRLMLDVTYHKKIDVQTLESEGVLLTAILLDWEDIVELLLQRGLSPNAKKSDSQFSALQFAIQKNNEEIALSLIRHGADVNYSTYFDANNKPGNYNPLVEAHKKEFFKVVQELLLKGAKQSEGVPPIPLTVYVSGEALVSVPNQTRAFNGGDYSQSATSSSVAPTIVQPYAVQSPQIPYEQY